MGLRKLEEEKDKLQDELYMLHFVEHSPEMYMQRRSELEYKIASLEEQIEFEERFGPFRIALMVAVVIGICIFIYGFINS